MSCFAQARQNQLSTLLQPYSSIGIRGFCSFPFQILAIINSLQNPLADKTFDWFRTACLPGCLRIVGSPCQPLRKGIISPWLIEYHFTSLNSHQTINYCTGWTIALFLQLKDTFLCVPFTFFFWQRFSDIFTMRYSYSEKDLYFWKVVNSREQALLVWGWFLFRKEVLLRRCQD